MTALALIATVGASVVSCPVPKTGAAYESVLDAAVLTRSGGGHFLLAVDSRSGAPLLYTFWTPTTIVSYVRPGCEASP